MFPCRHIRAYMHRGVPLAKQSEIAKLAPPAFRYFVALREELSDMGVAGKRIRTDLAS